MAKALAAFGLILICAFTSNAVSPRQIQDTAYTGGQFLTRPVSAFYCIRYCRKLGDCWGVDYFRYSRRCSVHVDETRCDPTRRRYSPGADHFRVKECSEKNYEREPIDYQVAELKARLDAKHYTSDCLMNIYEASYAKGDTLFSSGTSLTRCAASCVSTPGCRSVNFHRTSGNCYHFTEPFTVSSLVSSYCCHHVSISCYQETPTTSTPSSDASAGPSQSPTPEPYQYHYHHYHHGRRVSTTPGTSNVPTTNHVTNTPPTTTPGTTPVVTSPVTSPVTAPPPVISGNTGNMDPEVCPFLRQDGTSRQGGIIVADSEGITTPSQCRDHCQSINEAAGTTACYGADWNTETNHCFTFDTVPTLDMMNYTDKYIIHFQQNECSSIPSLQCVVHGPVDFSQDTVVLGPVGPAIPHTSEDCDGFCTYSYSFNVDSITGAVIQRLERGCGTDNNLGWRQCAGPPPTTTSLSTTCHCSGDNCNAMGFGGLYQLHAYYPFDYSAEDLSGFNRGGTPVGSLKYTPLDKRSARAAAIFDGRSYVELRGMKLSHRSEVQFEGDVQVSSAVAVWVKRMAGKDGPMTILSDDETRERSTLSIYSDLSPTGSNMHTVTVGVRLGNESYTATSQEMPVGEWQFVCMNVVDTVSPPELRLYVGNGSPSPVTPVTTVLPETPSYIDVSSKTVTIGKQSGQDLVDPFIGGLDELRFFQGELTVDDIWVLMLMFNYDPAGI